MAQQSVQLSAEEAATLRNVFQLVNQKIAEAKQACQNVENQHKAILNTLVTLILGGKGFPNIQGNWSVKLSDENGAVVDPVVLIFEDGAASTEVIAEKTEKVPSTAKKSKKK